MRENAAVQLQGLTRTSLNLQFKSSSTTSREFVVDEDDLKRVKAPVSDKLKINCHMNLKQFHEIYHSKTLGCLELC